MTTTLEFKQKEKMPITFTIKKNGQAISLTDTTITFAVKKKKSDTNYVIKKEDTAFDKTDAGSGILYLTLTSDDLDIARGVYVAELEVEFNTSGVVKKSDDIIFIVNDSVIT